MSLFTALDGFILGRYEPVAELGSGTTSTVVLAQDHSAKREVAVKLVLDDKDLVDRAKAEIAAMSRLKHPNIAGLIDYGWHNGRFAIVMEPAPGASLDAAWAERAPRGREAIDAARQTLNALSHAHVRGVVHRDIKPANLILDSTGMVRLIDFGVAHVADRSALTMVGDLIGTIAYMSPEQARGEAATAASDVWSASIVAYEGLAGDHPLLGRDPRETHELVCRGRVTRLRKMRPRLSPQIEAAIHAGLESRPENRPRAEELAAELLVAAPPSRRRQRMGVARARWASGDRLLRQARSEEAFEVVRVKGISGPDGQNP